MLIELWLRRYLENASAAGFVVGLSGGVDSAVSAALAVRAVGNERVFGVLLPCDSDEDDARLGREVARWLGISLIKMDIAGPFEAMIGALRYIWAEDPNYPVVLGNLKARLRMAALYALANAHNYLVLGTGNKTEETVGYFTKYGDGGVDLLPLGDLYKTQVWELARELGVPQEIIDRAPTAGLWAGQTDEGEMGITYTELDSVLAAIEADDVSGIDLATLERVQNMIIRSEHKRAMPPIYEGV